MCNHYRKKPEVSEWSRSVVEGITIPIPLPDLPEHTYPKYLAPVVIEEAGARTLIAMRWGVWPFYARDKAQFITNARNDGLLTKPVWKQSATKRRCLIPATGYYEPGTGPVGAKGEILFTVKQRPMFFFAGLWDSDPDASGTRGFTMVTTDPNDYVRPFHDRMPVVLDDVDALSWLGGEPLPDAKVAALCRGLPSEALLHETLAPKLKITRSAKKSPPDEGPQLF